MQEHIKINQVNTIFRTLEYLKKHIDNSKNEMERQYYINRYDIQKRDFFIEYGLDLNILK